MTLFVSGCTHHCKVCFNQEAWDFGYGDPFTEAVENELLEALDHSYISGLTLLGGEIRIAKDDGKLVWECPKCGNRDQSKMNVARRTCGYIGTQYWNQGRTQEIQERVLHL